MLTLNNCKLKTQKYNESFSRVYSCSLNSKTLSNNICVRTMISSKSFYAIRALFNTAMMLSNTEMVDKINSQNTRPFVECAVDLALDHNKGVLQHKAVILKHTTNRRFSADYFYEYFCTKTNRNNVHWEPNTTVDCRTVNEIGVLNEYQNAFGTSITWTLATLDKRPSNFPYAKQTNVDFWVYVKRAIGLNTFGKGFYQDEKSGTDIFRHTTRGSIGTVFFDEHGNNIQTMNDIITHNVLARINLRKIAMLEEALRADGIYNVQFDKTLFECYALCNKMINESFANVVKLHNQLQNILWEQFQCNPEFNRSLSFVFIKQIVTHPTSIKEEIFSQAFKANIQEHKIYNLDKKQDFNVLYKAMIYAGKEVDPEFVKKLEYLHNNGITFNNNLLQVLVEVIKHGL